MFDDPLCDFVKGPRSCIELHAGVAVALDVALDHEEQIDPDRLRTGIAAPGAPDG
ncbi:hypothetical protein D3C87_1720240 [compost metagenome]